MAFKWEISCIACNKKNSFSDVKDISHAHWTILGWIVELNEPRVICPQCDYPKKKEK